MGAKCLTKSERRQEIKKILDENPFFTDEELAQLYKVSVQTIRLDRAALDIPEVRERIKLLAEHSYGEVKSITGLEIIGDLIELKLNESAISLLTVSEEMVLSKAKVIRGHLLFAQANSLAVAMIDSPLALTGSANVKYIAPVSLDERVICRAKVMKKRGEKFLIKIVSTVNNSEVFRGNFLVFAKGKEEVL
ncbi:MAG: transcription factor FapR [Bacillota bacterium]|nr:transcription factor FapR [Bacillota bacterium]